MYDQPYYEAFRNGSLESARVIVPRLLDWITPSSVIDLGCGLGDWLSVFKAAGIQDITGVDGSHVQMDQLSIPAANFVAHDLTRVYAQNRQYGMAMSVEVGEHLPAESSQSLVQSLTQLAPIVLFSAAIPGQRGFHHVNCQWPEYWARLFANRGYVALDCLRSEIWNDSRIDWWYRQNLIVYASVEGLERWPKLAAFPRLGSPLPLVHPEMLLRLEADLASWGGEWERKYWDLWAQRQPIDDARVTGN